MGLGTGCGEQGTRGGMPKQVVALSNGKLVSQLDADRYRWLLLAKEGGRGGREGGRGDWKIT